MARPASGRIVFDENAPSGAARAQRLGLAILGAAGAAAGLWYLKQRYDHQAARAAAWEALGHRRVDVPHS